MMQPIAGLEAGWRVVGAQCFLCGHRWVAVVEDGEFEPSLECPKCRNTSGAQDDFEGKEEKERCP